MKYVLLLLVYAVLMGIILISAPGCMKLTNSEIMFEFMRSCSGKADIEMSESESSGKTHKGSCANINKEVEQNETIVSNS